MKGIWRFVAVDSPLRLRRNAKSAKLIFKLVSNKSKVWGLIREAEESRVVFQGKDGAYRKSKQKQFPEEVRRTDRNSPARKSKSETASSHERNKTQSNQREEDRRSIPKKDRCKCRRATTGRDEAEKTFRRAKARSTDQETKTPELNTKDDQTMGVLPVPLIF